MYQALYRTWRPRTFDDVVGQGPITDTLKRQVDTGRLSHAYLFTGTRGTGKTSCAKILARAVNCEQPNHGNPCNQCAACRGIEDGSILDVLELDAASNNGVDQVRALRDEAVYSPVAVKKRVYIVDEVHMLSTAAFNALLKILEEPPAHLLFILATTELHKVPATIKSRCQQFAFKRILPEEIAKRLMFVTEQERLGLTGEGADMLARLADGGMRDALSLLDQCVNASGTIGECEILDALGMAGNREIVALLRQIAEERSAEALTILSRLYGAGKDVATLLGELSALCRDLLICRSAPQSGGALLTGGYDEATLRHLTNLLPLQRLTQVLTQIQTTLAELPRSGNRRTAAELCLIRLCDRTLDASATGLAARIARLEGMLTGGTVPVTESRQGAVDSPDAEATAGKAGEKQEPAPVRVDAPQEPGFNRNMEAAPNVPTAQGEKTDPASIGVSRSIPEEFWPGLLEQLKGKVPMGEYMFLKKAQGRVEGGSFHLYVDSEFTRAMLNKPTVLQPITSAVEGVLGAGRRVALVVGTPPETSDGRPGGEPASSVTSSGTERDAFGDLLALSQQFDTIVIKE